MKIKKITKAKQMLDIIEPIPPSQFIIDDYEFNGKCCFLGHINKAIKGNALADYDGCGARRLTKKFLMKVHKKRADGATVNNHPTNGYRQRTPKGRVMAMLNDMVKHGY